MDVVRKSIKAEKLKGIVRLPKSLSNQTVEIVVRPKRERSLVDELCGCASNLEMSSEQLRHERRMKL